MGLHIPSGGARRSEGRAMLLVLALLLTREVRGQGSMSAVIPADAANCAVTTPPERAGIAATPGGFLMVFPRNEGLTDTYTGCKTLWIVDTERTPRLATLYFERGRIARAVAYDTRDPLGAIEGACAFPEGRSLLPTTGRRFTDAACQGLTGEGLYALRLPTWPRSCLARPDAPPCTADPR